MSDSEENTEEIARPTYLIKRFDYRFHLKNVMSLDKIVFEDSDIPPYEEDIWKNFKGYVLFNSSNKEEILGYLMYKTRPKYDYYDSDTRRNTNIDLPDIQIEVVGVHPKLQGKGLGTRLMKKILQDFPNKSFSLLVETKKPQNITFYQKFGFFSLGKADEEDDLTLMYRPSGNKRILSRLCVSCCIESQLMEEKTHLVLCSYDCLASFIKNTTFLHTKKEKK